MKKVFVIIAVLAVITSHAQIRNATLQASGLTCALCSKAIYQALLAVPFIGEVQPDIQHSLYNIAFKPLTVVDLDKISKAVTDAGFSVSMLKITADFNNVEIRNDAHMLVNDMMFHFMNVSPQTLNGTKTLTLIDKNFVAVKEYKRYGKMTSMKCYETGVMGSCCSGDKKNTGVTQRIYHVTI